MIPKKSSGALWSVEEDERLQRAVLTMVERFPGRSLAAVVTRIAFCSPRWKVIDELKKGL